MLLSCWWCKHNTVTHLPVNTVALLCQHGWTTSASEQPGSFLGLQRSSDNMQMVCEEAYSAAISQYLQDHLGKSGQEADQPRLQAIGVATAAASAVPLKFLQMVLPQVR